MRLQVDPLREYPVTQAEQFVVEPEQAVQAESQGTQELF